MCEQQETAKQVPEAAGDLVCRVNNLASSIRSSACFCWT